MFAFFFPTLQISYKEDKFCSKTKILNYLKLLYFSFYYVFLLIIQDNNLFLCLSFKLVYNAIFSGISTALNYELLLHPGYMSSDHLRWCPTGPSLFSMTHYSSEIITTHSPRYRTLLYFSPNSWLFSHSLDPTHNLPAVYTPYPPNKHSDRW